VAKKPTGADARAKPVEARAKSDAALARVVDDLDKTLGIAGDDETRLNEVRKLADAAVQRANNIRFDIELAFQVKASLAALVKGHILYVGPAVPNSRIVLITLCIVAILATFFGGIFALLHAAGGLHR